MEAVKKWRQFRRNSLKMITLSLIEEVNFKKSRTGGGGQWDLSPHPLSYNLI